MDFNDVFGGPPRRFSMQEMRVRCSFSPETIESDHDERTPTLFPWSKEKPVFGEDISNSSVVRRRQHHHHQSDDFYVDIFRGDGSSYNSPRRSDLDRDNVFCSSPSGSRAMSPSRHSPSRNEPFSTSFPAQFSLPAKLSKATDIPTFGSRNHSRNTANGLTSPHNSSTFLSRFSNQANRSGPLSHQSSMSSEYFSPPHTDHRLGSETDGRNADDNNAGNQFHFSIYKWAGREVPMLIPLSSGKSQKEKSRFNSFAESRLLSEANYQDEVVESFEVELEKQVFMSEENIKEAQVLFGESHIEVAVTKLGSGSKEDSVLNGEVEKNIKEEVKSFDETKVKESIVKKEASLKSRGKSIRAFMTDQVDQSGKGAEMKENKMDTTSKGIKSADLNRKITPKKTETDQKSEKVEKPVLQGDRKSGVKGKFRDFFQIFNQEADASLKSDVSPRSKSYRWKTLSTQRKEDNEVATKTPRTEVNTRKTEENLSSKNTEKKENVTLKVEEKVEAKQYTDTKTPSVSSNLSSNNQKNEYSSDSKPSVEIFDDSLEWNFLVQELPDYQQKNITQNDDRSEDIKALDAKIHQWSIGKKGNIRSLLSTLQYVLWQGSGWQPVPLVDLIEANSVKRAYQKALLRLHPDKLQQKGAASDHKYIAEKVFDILQEAWDHFNTLGL